MADELKKVDEQVNVIAKKTGQSTTVIYIIAAIALVIVASKVFGF